MQNTSKQSKQNGMSQDKDSCLARASRTCTVKPSVKMNR